MEGQVNTNRKWLHTIVFVALALASLSSIAMTRPHRDQGIVYITPMLTEVCGAHSVGPVDQYLAAVAWAEQGGELPYALTVGCMPDRTDLPASYATYPGEGADRFRQYMAAIEWAENGGPLPVALVVSDSSEGWRRFEQYSEATRQ
jgi:hypothetical protein